MDVAVPPAAFAALDPGAHVLPADLPPRLLTPALVLWRAAVDHNLATMLAHCGGPGRWRPHLKTTKAPVLWEALLDAGLRRFKTATTRETAVLCALLDRRGLAGDVLLAQPLVGPALRRLGQLAAAHPRQRLSLLVEDGARLAEVPDGLDLFVDVNPGMDRTGVPLERRDELVALARACGERLAGLHVYDGHLHDADRALRTRRVHEGCARVVELARALADAGAAPGEVVTAGTPAALAALSFDGWDELPGGAPQRVSPGTVVLHDARSQRENPDLGLVPAATVASRVLSHPTPGRVTCDAGHKAVAAESDQPCAEVLGRPDLLAGGPSEEHLPLLARGADVELPTRGALLQLIPEHVCPTVNLAEQAVLVEPDGRWSVVDVAARAHELLLED